MKFLSFLFQFKSQLALMAGILAGFTVLSLVIIFLLNDDSAEIIFWIGIMISMTPLFIADKEKNGTKCKTISKQTL